MVVVVVVVVVVVAAVVVAAVVLVVTTPSHNQDTVALKYSFPTISPPLQPHLLLEHHPRLLQPARIRSAEQERRQQPPPLGGHAANYGGRF